VNDRWNQSLRNPSTLKHHCLEGTTQVLSFRLIESLTTPLECLKLWKWSGPLFYKSAENPLCKVTMHVPINGTQGVVCAFLSFSKTWKKLKSIACMTTLTYAPSCLLSVKPPQLALVAQSSERCTEVPSHMSSHGKAQRVRSNLDAHPSPNYFIGCAAY